MSFHKSDWFQGAAPGSHYFDWGGMRYHVVRLRDGRYSARREGFVDTLVGYFAALDDAKAAVETESGYRIYLGRLDCVRNSRIACPGHDSFECCIEDEG